MSSWMAAPLAVGATVLLAVATTIVLSPGAHTASLLGVGSAREWLALIVLAVLGASALFPVVALHRPELILAGLLLVCPLAPGFFEDHPLDLGPAKLYLYDLFFFLFLAYVALRFAARRPGDRVFSMRPPLLVPLGLMLAMGVLQIGRAVAIGLNVNDSFGDFRRGTVYLIAYLFPFLLPDRRRAVRIMTGLLLGASGLLIVRGVGEALLGRFQRTMILDAAHILRHFELVVVATLAYYGVVRLIVGRGGGGGAPVPGASGAAGAESWVPLFALTSLATLVIIVGNFRSVWLGFVFGAGLVLLVLPLRFRAAALALAFVGLLGVAGGFLIVRDLEVSETGRTLQDEIALKIERFQNYDRDKNVLWRYQSYEAALAVWSRHPLIGAGLGTKTTFFIMRSDGSIAVASRHRTHNSYLWVLLTTGVAGMVVLALFHGSFVLGAGLRMRRLLARTGSAPPIALALFGAYGAFMLTTGFDVLLEESIPVLWLVSAMGTVDLATSVAEEDAAE
jgi:O-antigen ligase